MRRDGADRKKDGATYTPISLAGFIADRIAEHHKDSGNTLRILDPACGDGILIEELLKRFPSADFQATLCDIDEVAIQQARIRLKEFDDGRLTFVHGSFLDTPPKQYDLIIANPPYVRTHNLDRDYAKTLTEKYGLKGRIDLSYPFIFEMLDRLSETGTLGFVTSNRFMTTMAGKPVRKKLVESKRLKEIIDFGDSELFDAAVLPAVIIAGSADDASPIFLSIYKTKLPAVMDVSIDSIMSLDSGTTIRFHGQNSIIAKGTLETSGEQVWALSQDDRWLQTVRENTWKTFGEIGKIRVGIKTTADKVFIMENEVWADMGKSSPELLRPIITSDIARRWHSIQPTRQVLYPHECRDKDMRCKAINLSDFPNSLEYLEKHRSVLAGRTYLAKAKREWFEIWVPQNPSLWNAPKLVFPDIASEPVFFMDTDGLIVNGGCYWMTGDEDELWLAMAVANTEFMLKFYDTTTNNRLYAGRRRFMSQYVETFPLPRKDTAESVELIRLAKEAHRTGKSPDQHLIEHLTAKAFGFIS